MARAAPTRLVAAAALIGLLARGLPARADGTKGVLRVGDSPVCNYYDNRKTCPLAVHVQSYLDDKKTMTVSVARACARMHGVPCGGGAL